MYKYFMYSVYASVILLTGIIKALRMLIGLDLGYKGGTMITHNTM